MKHIKEILQDQFAELHLEFKEHIRGDLYYPNCDVSRKIINLMGRKAFKTHEIELLKELGKSCGLKETKIYIDNTSEVF